MVVIRQPSFSLYKRFVTGGNRYMSRVCSVCGKSKMSGNTVSHSNRKAPTHWNANIQKISVVDDNGTVSRKYVCTRCLRNGAVKRKSAN